MWFLLKENIDKIKNGKACDQLSERYLKRDFIHINHDYEHHDYSCMILCPFRGCSYENSFPVVFPLNWENYYFLAFIYEIFPRLGEIYFGGLLGGKILREANIQNG